MQSLLLWPPILWTLRVSVLTVLSSGTAVFVLLIARFFRWKHLKLLLTADLPRIHSLGGEFGGTKATVQLVQHDYDRLETVVERIDELQVRIETWVKSLMEEGGRE